MCLNWLRKTGEISSFISNSTQGNLVAAEISSLADGAMYLADTNSNGKVDTSDKFESGEDYYKASDDASTLLTTGAVAGGKLNNIYDIVGNVREWSMEYGLNDSGSARYVQRGVSYNMADGAELVRRTREGAEKTVQPFIGFRSALYIK